jgi:lysophospholipase L1-like esterase
MQSNRIFLFILIIALLFACGCQRTNAAEKSSFLEEAVFLGDSITAHMSKRANITENQLWVTKERYLNLDSRITYAKIVAPDSKKEERIADVAKRLHPRYLIITLGIDYGVYYYRNELSTFAKYYEKLLDALSEASPDTTLILQSIFPVTKACKNLTNQMIDRANAVIAQIANKRELVYLDTQRVLRDEEGYLREEFCNSEDGIHLSEKAYAEILSFIEAKAVEMGWQV